VGTTSTPPENAIKASSAATGGNCVVCGKNDDLDMQRCCSAECDLIMDAWPIPCDECGLSVAPDQIHECGHCGDCICMGCLVEHAKGHSQL